MNGDYISTQILIGEGVKFFYWSIIGVGEASIIAEFNVEDGVDISESIGYTWYLGPFKVNVLERNRICLKRLKIFLGLIGTVIYLL